MLKLTFNLTRQEGKTYFNKESFINYLSKLPDGKYSMYVEKIRKKRSTEQNKYYFGVLLQEYGIACGASPEECHTHLAWTYLTEHSQNPITGEQISKTKSTTELNTKQFEEYMELCRRDCLETYNHIIPLPNEDKL